MLNVRLAGGYLYEKQLSFNSDFYLSKIMHL